MKASGVHIAKKSFFSTERLFSQCFCLKTQEFMRNITLSCPQKDQCSNGRTQGE
jgi:hypothetical protein